MVSYALSREIPYTQKTSKFIIIDVSLETELSYWPLPNPIIVELKLFSFGSRQSESFMVIVLFTFVSSEMGFITELLCK